MNFLRAKLFMILCFAVVALGIGVFVLGYLVSLGNQAALQDIEMVVQGAGGLRSQVVRENQISAWQAGVEEYQQALEEVKTRIKQTSARPVLFPDVFEEDIGNNYSYYRRFADQYCQFVENLVSQLGAQDKPSESEEESIRQTRRNEQAGGTASGGESEQSKIETLIVDNRKTRAQSIRIYADPAIFCCYNHWAARPSGTDHSVMLNDIWYTQVAAWIQEDAIGVIKQFNEEHKTGSVAKKESVYNSPVKRILRLGFNGTSPSSDGSQVSRSSGGSVSSRSENTQALPQYVVASAPTAAATAIMGGGMYPEEVDPSIAAGLANMGGYAAPTAALPDPAVPAAVPTKGGMISAAPLQASDDLINVVHFSLGVMIDSSKIHDFINALQTTQLQSSLLSADGANSFARNQITVLQVEIDPIDIAAEDKAGYYYGGASVKKLSLICQYVFFRSGYEENMPASIKSIFGAAVPGGI